MPTCLTRIRRTVLRLSYYYYYFATRGQRPEALAEAAGIDRGVMDRAGLRGGKRRRLEEGGDESGVT